MANDPVRDWALTISAQLADIETEVGSIGSKVMQAAIHHQCGPADTAQQQTDRLDDMVTALSRDLRQFRKALRL
jgi:hypothetical protein